MGTAVVAMLVVGTAGISAAAPSQTGADKRAENADAARENAGGGASGQQVDWNGAPGNNGTVKIDGIPFDDHPNNEPHPGCVFQLDFYNYDEGDLTGAYTFALQPPTGRSVLLSDSVDIGEDPNGGGRDLDASVTIDLSDALADSGETPHPQQGYHVKLTVNAEGSIGADVKHKVFWVECAVPVVGGGGGGGGGRGRISDERDADVLGEQIERGDSAEVMGTQFETLPVTGINLGILAGLATMLVGSGAMLKRSSRRRRF